MEGARFVFHQAALPSVPRSIEDPHTTHEVNATGTLHVLMAARDAGVQRVVYASSSSVYGPVPKLPREETDRTNPISPYAVSKLAGEQYCMAFWHSYGLETVALRYFNAGGSTGNLGEDHDPETHLIPVVLDAALGRRDPLTIFGDDYETPDGTCIRDYIHVVDLAEAHVLALDAMEQNFSGPLNLGSEDPFTVLQVVRETEKVTGLEVPFAIGPRRAGDPPALLASSKRAEEVLGWRKQHSSLEEIVRSAFEWRQNNPDGFAKR